VEFLRQFWINYLSPSPTQTKRKELESLVQSLKRTQERMDAVRTYAVTSGGEGMGQRVLDALGSVAGSISKAISLWEKIAAGRS
jgi:hypothetical protein